MQGYNCIGMSSAIDSIHAVALSWMSSVHHNDTNTISRWSKQTDNQSIGRAGADQGGIYIFYPVQNVQTNYVTL